MVTLNNVNLVNKASKFVKEKKKFVELSRLNCNLLQSKKTNFKKEPTSIIDFLEYIDLQSFSSDFSKARIFKTKVENRTSRWMPGSVKARSRIALYSDVYCIYTCISCTWYTLGRFLCSRLEHPTEPPLHPIYAGYWLMFMIDMNIEPF